MPKYEWKVIGVPEDSLLDVFAAKLESALNHLEKEGFEVQKLEVKKGVLVTGRRPARPSAKKV